ncbi:hypothetical protein Trisim1_007016 [Trichoderma cf. simile WF8]
MSSIPRSRSHSRCVGTPKYVAKSAAQIRCPRRRLIRLGCFQLQQLDEQLEEHGHQCQCQSSWCTAGHAWASGEIDDDGNEGGDGEEGKSGYNQQISTIDNYDQTVHPNQGEVCEHLNGGKAQRAGAKINGTCIYKKLGHKPRWTKYGEIRFETERSHFEVERSYSAACNTHSPNGYTNDDSQISNANGHASIQYLLGYACYSYLNNGKDASLD